MTLEQPQLPPILEKVFFCILWVLIYIAKFYQNIPYEVDYHTDVAVGWQSQDRWSAPGSLAMMRTPFIYEGISSHLSDFFFLQNSIFENIINDIWGRCFNRPSCSLIVFDWLSALLKKVMPLVNRRYARARAPINWWHLFNYNLRRFSLLSK